jgi:imidazole glycerol-phosphate synthase subunit HisH
MISVIDYGVANIGSLMNMCRKCGIPAQKVSTSDAILDAEKLLLPGVGSFDNGMAYLRDRSLEEAVTTAARDKQTAIMGICLGMQLLGDGSQEGEASGLGLLRATSRRFSFPAGTTAKIPHQGWSHPVLHRSSPILEAVEDRTRFYFSHSYHLVCDDPSDVLASAHYGIDFTAMVRRDNIFGVQFHPEKSHRYGMALLRNFAALH